MKIAVLGTGGVGGYFGARLAAAGEDVHFVARGAHLDAMVNAGLLVNSALGDVHLRPVQATDDPAAIGPVDLIVVAVKLYDTEAVLPTCRALLGPDTSIVSFQNGVGAARDLAAVGGAERVYGGVTYILSTIGTPGVIDHVGTIARLIIGELDGQPSARTDAFRAACEGAGIDIVVTSSINGEIWSKFTFLAALSGVTTLLRMPVGRIRADDDTRAFFRAAVDEAVAVARACCIALPGDAVDRHMATFDGLDPEFTSSMLYDLDHGNRLELAWLSGTIIDHGRREGVPTPVHKAIYAALKLHADGATR